jgi:L-ascorbate metabolism protein UlaG (beta-lactamase superfamily)
VPREVSPGLTLEALADVDMVLITHASADHLDMPTLSRLSRSATVVVPPGAAARVSPLRFARLVELSPGHTLDHRGVEVWAEEVRHGDRQSPAQSYVLRSDGPTVYVCGASGYHAGFGEIGRRHWPDVALLPIGGYSPRSFRKRHMSPADALYAFEDLRARVMVPIRYGSFALSYERLSDPERWLAELVAERHLERFVVRLQAGETRVFVPPGAAGVESNRFEVDSGGMTSPALAMARAQATPPAELHTPQAGPSPRTSPGLEPAAPRLPPALIIDTDEHDRRREPADDQDDETHVFDQPSGLRRLRESQAGPSAARADQDDDDDEDDDDDVDQDDVRTRALVLELPEDGSSPLPLPIRGSSR